MKARHPILVLVAVGLGGVLLSGCAVPPAKTPAEPSAHAKAAVDDSDAVGDDSTDDSSQTTSRGNPEALAHYAAGVSYEWNDEDDLALKEFDKAALADPANESLVLRTARRYLKDKKTGEAVTLLSKSARRPDASALLVSWLARAELQAGKPGQALTASSRSIRLEPRAFDGYESQVEILFHENRFAEAARTLNRAAKSIRPKPSELVALAGLYEIYVKAQPKDGEVKTNAIALLDRVAKMDFDSPRLWQTVGDSYIQFDQPKKATAIFVKLLATAPEPSLMRDNLHEKLAAIYFQADDKTNATKQLEAIVRDNPTRYPRAWYFLGELAYGDDNLSDALDDYENAIHWDPAFEEAWYKLALVKIDLHRTDEALQTLDTARLKFPRTFLGEFYSGIAYLHLKRYPDAIHHFNVAEVIGLASNTNSLDYRFYFQFGEACERNQEFKLADEYLQKCINLSPDFGEALNYLGYMLADRGEQLPRARALIEKAVRLEPKNGAYLDSLGWVLFKQKQPQRALPWLLKAGELSPEPDATVLDHLGEVYLALHQTEKAIEAWKKSLSIESNPDVKKKLESCTGGA